MGFPDDHRRHEQRRRTSGHADGVHRHRMNGRQAADEHRGLGEAQGAPKRREHREQRQRLTERRARHQYHPAQRESRSRERHEAKALLPLGGREQERHERHEREQDLTEACMQLHQRVVGEGVRGGELHEAEHDRAYESASAREREPQGGHQDQEQRRGKQEAQSGTPQRVELAVREADTDRVATREDRARDERRQRDTITVGAHAATLRRAVLVESRS